MIQSIIFCIQEELVVLGIDGIIVSFISWTLMFIIMKISSLVSFILGYDFLWYEALSCFTCLIIEQIFYRRTLLVEVSLMWNSQYYESWVYSSLLYTYRVCSKKNVIFQYSFSYANQINIQKCTMNQKNKKMKIYKTIKEPCKMELNNWSLTW